MECLESRELLSADPFLAASGTVIRDGHGTGDPVLLQGTNLGSWLYVEPWMAPIDSSGTATDEVSLSNTLTSRFGQATAASLIHTYEQNWITTTDLDNIKALGMNLVRVPISWRTVENADGSWRSDAFDRMDWLVTNAAQRGLYVLFDLHDLPGPGKSTSFWSDSSSMAQTTDLWQRIAQHFNGNATVAGYDLLNEPVVPESGSGASPTLLNFYNTLYTAIRAVDPGHMIVMEGTYHSWDWDMLPNPATYGWTNVAYQMHEYQWGSTGNPAGVEAGADGQANDFRAHESWNVPALMGEFNDFGPGSNPSSVWDYSVQDYQKNNMSWSEWAYKAIHGTGSDSWGIYNPTTPEPAIPNLLTDSAATIQSDWSQWTTTNAFAINPMLQTVLNVTVRASFRDADINAPARTGGAAYDPTNGQWTVLGGGNDIGNTSDQFHFASESLAGDGSIVARVISEQNTDPWAKAGVMFRDSTDPSAAFADVMATPGNGVTFQWRSTSGAVPSSVNVTGITAPVWEKLTRVGSSFSASYSADGSTWTQLGTPQTVAMNSTVQVGLAVTAHNIGLLNTSTFSNVSVLPSGWADSDIGSPGLPGFADFNSASGTWTVGGGGGDIWNNADQFNFASTLVSGDRTISARVTSLQNTDRWAKAGVMIRNDDGAGSAFADVVLSPSNGVSFQWRTTANGPCSYAQVNGITGPVWLMLTRAGNSFAASYSLDDSVWTPIGSAQTINMSTAALGGLAVTAHNNAQLAAATFTGLSTLNQAPTVAVPAGATPNPVTGTSTALSVLGADDGGEAGLTYTWAAAGPAAVAFGSNGTNASKSTTAAFAAAGTYDFAVTIADASGLTVASGVRVVVGQTLTAIRVSPAAPTLLTYAAQAFAATAYDQFGQAMAAQPGLTWSATGDGSILPGGAFTAGATPGSASVTAQSGTVSASATVTVVAPPPTQVGLASAFNRAGIFVDGVRTSSSGADGHGNGYSSAQLGASLAYNGSTLSLGPANANDMVRAAGQTIALTQGHYSRLNLLGLGVNGTQKGQVFTVRYTDGTAQAFTQTLSDWGASTPAAGETPVRSMPYRDTSSGGRSAGSWKVYGYTLALNPAKVVASLTLPSNGNVDILAIGLLG